MLRLKIKDTHFSKNYVIRIYEKWVKKSYEAFDKGKYDISLYNIAICARWMYNFNIRYTDNRLEKLIKEISNIKIGNSINYLPNNNCCVFLDSIGTTKCLNLQYLRALISLNREIVYILHNDLSQCKSIIDELNQYPNSHIFLIKQEQLLINQAQEINKIIYRFKPAQIFLHMIPQDVVSLLAIYNISGAKKYNIDLQDHTYWLGATFIDYNIQFRDYGEKISIQKRNLKPKQIIRLPYYPIKHLNNKFEGFTNIPSDAIIIFTGGAQYKMLGKNDIFFNLMDTILDCSPKAHILVATIGDNILFSQKVLKMKHRERVHCIGMRKDINEVFNHSDIYLVTYPLIGGLMTQYAAAYARPILAYAEKDDANLAEGVVNHKLGAVNTLYSLDSFKASAQKLLTDKKFREKEGLKNQHAIINEDDFSKYLEKILECDTTDIEWKHHTQPNYEEMIKFYLQNENSRIHAGLKSMITYLKFKVFFYFPKESITIIQCVLRWIKAKR